MALTMNRYMDRREEKLENEKKRREDRILRTGRKLILMYLFLATHAYLKVTQGLS